MKALIEVRQRENTAHGLKRTVLVHDRSGSHTADYLVKQVRYVRDIAVEPQIGCDHVSRNDLWQH